jgi:glycerol-3-phosphate dehydrogenase
LNRINSDYRCINQKLHLFFKKDIFQGFVITRDIMKRIPLADLEKDPFDVVVIGAGINGSGAVQEIAARGYRVLIVDKDDFSSGATNRSSRILHGFCLESNTLLGGLQECQEIYGLPQSNC